MKTNKPIKLMACLISAWALSACVSEDITDKEAVSSSSAITGDLGSASNSSVAPIIASSAKSMSSSSIKAVSSAPVVSSVAVSSVASSDASSVAASSVPPKQTPSSVSVSSTQSSIALIEPPAFVKIPGIIQAENFNFAYDSDAQQNGDAECTSAVDGGVDSAKTSDAKGGNCHIGWTAADETLGYAIEVDKAGKFDLMFRLSSLEANKKIGVYLDNTQIGTVTGPGKGWDAWRDVWLRDKNISAGSHELELRFIDRGVNVNYIDVRKAAVVASSAPASSSSSSAPKAVDPKTIKSGVFLEENGIVAIEAEEYDSINNKKSTAKWYLTNLTKIPNIKPDPDGSHADTASGNGYMEILPDTRVYGHNDSKPEDKIITSGPNTNFHAKGGTGPTVNYKVYFNTPGTYYVWLRAFSTGKEDNGTHVGINGTWPATGERVQWCTGKKKWTWTRAQRNEPKEFHCGGKGEIQLKVPSKGIHTISVSMREDGFELDKIIMARSKSYEPKDAGLAPKYHHTKPPKQANNTPAPAAPDSKLIKPPKGRLAVVADGNSPDPDDIGATAVMFGLLNKSGLANRLVHLSHSCDLDPFKSNGSQKIDAKNEKRRQNILDEVSETGIDLYGPFKNLRKFYNCRADQKGATDDLKDAINASTAADPLWIIEAGEPDLIGYALRAAKKEARQHVHVVSHHPANDDSGDFFTWKQILNFGVKEHQIGDQNVKLQTAPSVWNWAKNHKQKGIAYIWDMLDYAERDGVVKFQNNKFDCSDAGMVYWWITGANNGGKKKSTPKNMKDMLLM